MDPADARGTRRGAGAVLGDTVDEGLRTAERLAELSSAAVRGAVECGVQTAYTVIDEYMRRGHEAYDRARDGSPRPDRLTAAPLSHSSQPTHAP